MPEEPTTQDYYQVLPLAPQPESVTTVTQSPKHVPQIYRQCWGILRGRIERGPRIHTFSRSALLKEMDAIEKQVRG